MRTILCLLLLLAARPLSAQVIELDGRPFDCDTAYTTYEMGWCARHLLDSATTGMHALVDTMRSGLEREVVAWRAEGDSAADAAARSSAMDQVEFLLQARAHLDSAQVAFEQYASHHGSLVGDLYGFGRERTIAELMTAYALVVARPMRSPPMPTATTKDSCRASPAPTAATPCASAIAGARCNGRAPTMSSSVMARGCPPVCTRGRWSTSLNRRWCAASDWSAGTWCYCADSAPGPHTCAMSCRCASVVRCKGSRQKLRSVAKSPGRSRSTTGAMRCRRAM